MGVGFHQSSDCILAMTTEEKKTEEKPVEFLPAVNMDKACLPILLIIDMLTVLSAKIAELLWVAIQVVFLGEIL